MKIISAQIALQGERSAHQYYRADESLQLSRSGGLRPVDFSFTRHTEVLDADFDSYLSLAPQRGAAGSMRFRDPGQIPANPPRAAALPRAVQTGEQADPRLGRFFTELELLLIELLFEKLTGREFEVARLDFDAASAGAGAAAAPPAAQLSVHYSFSEVYREQESTRLRASGSVKTDAGAEITFDFELLMQRSFETGRRVEFLAGERRDPLLINLGTDGAELSERNYAFDLDADGAPERIAFATGASAFIALDHDNDGRISSGRELFGARSGDGFRELAAYDADDNGFIDAGDPVFSRLLAFSKDRDGADRLASLGSLGVGALYIGRAVTPFEIRDDANEALAGVRYSGVFLYEDSRIGSLQQVDLVV